MKVQIAEKPVRQKHAKITGSVIVRRPVSAEAHARVNQRARRTEIDGLDISLREAIAEVAEVHAVVRRQLMPCQIQVYRAKAHAVAVCRSELGLEGEHDRPAGKTAASVSRGEIYRIKSKIH